MTIKTITKNQYYQLVGLKTLAERYNDMLTEISDAMADILDSRDKDNIPDGYIMDTVYSNSDSLDRMLNLLEVEIEN